MNIEIDSIVDGVVTLSSPGDEIQSVDIDETIYQLSAPNIKDLSNGTARISTSYLGLSWDAIGERVYESGLDRGVLYLSDGTVVPWNGLISVNEAINSEVSSVYYDGMKINDLVTTGALSGSIRAITYPDELLELEGLAPLRPGFFAGEQKPKTFAFSYRTLINNDLEAAGYKIHIWYNVTAIPREKTYNTLSSDPSLGEFEWDISAVPEEVPGMTPTAHYVINSNDLDPWLLEEIEEWLYGSIVSEPSLPSLVDFVTYIRDWARIRIIDNGDGTWTAIAAREGYISFVDDEETNFQIVEVEASYINEETYNVSTTNYVP